MRPCSGARDKSSWKGGEVDSSIGSSYFVSSQLSFCMWNCSECKIRDNKPTNLQSTSLVSLKWNVMYTCKHKQGSSNGGGGDSGGFYYVCCYYRHSLIWVWWGGQTFYSVAGVLGGWVKDIWEAPKLESWPRPLKTKMFALLTTHTVFPPWVSLYGTSRHSIRNI